MSLLDRPTDLEQILHERFGLIRFRPGQREVIDEVIRGRDVLCVMPTGGGKSLCYQLPALVLDGLTLVVSPLIALMKDQVDALHQRGISATLLNSTLDPGEQRNRLVEIQAGLFNLVYVAPERFRSGVFVKAMAKLKPTLLAIDEAHCISQWGHDFRPDYAKIGQARKVLGFPPCVALTATATDVVRRDIADQLDLRDPALFVTGFDRPNLTYRVMDARRDQDKLSALSTILEQNPGPAIVYASSRARCEMIGEFVRGKLGKQVVVYHAGLSRDERTAAQDRFMEGGADVVVATNAFGMGVDKANIRSVVHFNMPGTLEAYYQEAGRAGRDGLPAACVLLYAPGDRMLQERFIENEYPPPDLVHGVFNYLCKLEDDPIEQTQAEIKHAVSIELNESAVGSALKLLEGAGAIERFMPRENMAIVRINLESDTEEPTSLVSRLSPKASVQRTVLLGVEGLVNRRYGEPVYFYPDQVATSLGIDRNALARALRVLTEELPIDYVPPFRGNALRVVDRSKKARELDIDFATLRDRKQREYDKLERMVNFAQANRCRRAFILGYFGDSNVESVLCGRCDNCIAVGGPAKASSLIDTEPGLEVVLKVLSGVARAKGRFGKTVVAQMLKGSGSEKMERMGLKSLSTFGLLPNFSQVDVSQIIDALTAAAFVEAVEIDRFRPIIRITEAGWARLRERPPSPMALVLPEDVVARIQSGGKVSTVTGEDSILQAEDEVVKSPLAGDPLFESLKAVRTEFARAAKQPAYCVFSNQTLEAIVRARPRSPAELAAIKGLGASRLERFGPAILDAIASFSTPDASRRAAGFTEPAKPKVATPKPRPTAIPASSYVPTEEWTWKLLEKGFTLDSIAAIRGLDRTAVIRHAALLARQGKVVPIDSFLDPERARLWAAWHDETGTDDQPPDGESFVDLWELFLTCVKRP